MGEEGAEPEDEGAPEPRAEEGGEDQPAGGEGEGGGRGAHREDDEAAGGDVLGEADGGPCPLQRGGVNGEAEAGLGAVGDEGRGACEGGAEEAGLERELAEERGTEQRGGRRADERVEGIPE